MSFIKKMLEVTDELETPRQYVKWAALAGISAVAARNVYLNRSSTKGIAYRLKPNIYVLLLGDSGIGKDWAISNIETMVREVDATRVISGRNTIQAIIQDMATTTSREGKEPILDARAFLVSREFHNLIQRDDIALTSLTEWFDNHAVWPYTTKGGGVQYLENVCVTMLGGSSPEHFSEAVPEVNIRGGFIGRTFMVLAEKRHRINALLEDCEDDVEIIDKSIIDNLKYISQAEGKFVWKSNAKEFFREWQHNWRTKYEENVGDKTGTARRLPDLSLKIAMLLSLSRENSLVLTLEDIQEGTGLVFDLLAHKKQVLLGKGQQQLAYATKVVLLHLVKAKDYQLTRKQLLTRGYGDYDYQDLERITESLVEAGAIRATNVAKNKVYRLEPLGVELLKGMLEG